MVGSGLSEENLTQLGESQVLRQKQQYGAKRELKPRANLFKVAIG